MIHSAFAAIALTFVPLAATAAEGPQAEQSTPSPPPATAPIPWGSAGPPALSFRPILRLFADFRADFAAEDGEETSFQIERAYVGGKAELGRFLSLVVVADFGRENQTSKQLAFLKFAYADLRPPPRGPVAPSLRFGLLPTFLVDESETAGAHRFVRASFADAWGLMPSADPGVALGMDLGEGLVGLKLGLFNGSGTGKSEADGGKVLAGMLVARPLQPVGAATARGLKVALFGSWERYSAERAPFVWARLHGWRAILGGILSFHADPVDAGVEIITVLDPLRADARAGREWIRGLSAYGQAHIPTATAPWGAVPTLDLLLRVDSYERNGRTTELGDADDHRQMDVIAGAGVTLGPWARLMIDWRGTFPRLGADEGANWNARDKLLWRQEATVHRLLVHTELRY